MEKVTAAIVARGADYNAADVYEAFAKKAELSARARVEMSKVKFMPMKTLLPDSVDRSNTLADLQPCGTHAPVPPSYLHH